MAGSRCDSGTLCLNTGGVLLYRRKSSLKIDGQQGLLLVTPLVM